MKKIYLTAFIASITLFSYAQESCSKITKQVKELQGITTYSTPLTTELGLSFSKIIAKETTFINVLACSDFNGSSYLAKGIYLKLEDGTIIKDEAADIIIRYQSANMYRYYATLILTDEQVELISQNKIVKYGVYNNEHDVSEKKSKNYINWINCLINSN